MKKQPILLNKTASKAQSTIKDFSAAKKISAKALDDNYEAAAKLLITQIKRAKQGNKNQYLDLLKELFSAYYSRLSSSKSEALTRKSEELIQLTGNVFTAHPDYPISELLRKKQKGQKHNFVAKTRKLFYSALT